MLICIPTGQATRGSIYAGTELVCAVMAVATARGWTLDHVYLKGELLYADVPAEDGIVITLTNINGVPAVSGQHALLKSPCMV